MDNYSAGDVRGTMGVPEHALRRNNTIMDMITVIRGISAFQRFPARGTASGDHLYHNTDVWIIDFVSIL
jgi:hypothetical protein